MKNSYVGEKREATGASGSAPRPAEHNGAGVTSGVVAHPAWQSFVNFCSRLQHGEIEKLKIQDGLPVLAEVTRKKVKFNGWG